MQIVFIHHSCFLVEIDDKVLIFDYFDGDRVNGYKFTGKIPTYEPQTRIYMYSSHCHQDHFDMDILRWADRYTNIKRPFFCTKRLTAELFLFYRITISARCYMMRITVGQYDFG